MCLVTVLRAFCQHGGNLGRLGYLLAKRLEFGIVVDQRVGFNRSHRFRQREERQIRPRQLHAHTDISLIITFVAPRREGITN